MLAGDGEQAAEVMQRHIQNSLMLASYEEVVEPGDAVATTPSA